MPRYVVMLTRHVAETACVEINEATPALAMMQGLSYATVARVSWKSEGEVHGSTQVEDVIELDDGEFAVPPTAAPRFSWRCLFGLHDPVSYDFGVTSKCRRCGWSHQS